MSYLQRLAEFSEKCPAGKPSKPSKPGFEGFEGDSTGQIPEFVVAAPVRAPVLPRTDDQVRADLQRWRRGLARLDVANPRAGLEAGRWEELVRDAAALFNDWADQAVRLGWHGADLFGVDLAELGDPAADPDAAHGLVLRLRGRPVQRLFDGGAHYALRSGGVGRFYRGDHRGRVPLWSLT